MLVLFHECKRLQCPKLHLSTSAFIWGHVLVCNWVAFSNKKSTWYCQNLFAKVPTLPYLAEKCIWSQLFPLDEELSPSWARIKPSPGLLPTWPQPPLLSVLFIYHISMLHTQTTGRQHLANQIVCLQSLLVLVRMLLPAKRDRSFRVVHNRRRESCCYISKFAPNDKMRDFLKCRRT